MDARVEWLRVPAAPPRAKINRAAPRDLDWCGSSDARGRIQEIATELAALQGTERPCLDRVRILVCAADPAPAPGDSPAPSSTARWLHEIAAGRAAVSRLAREIGAPLEVINLGTATDPGALDGVLDLPIRPGAADPCRGPAMDRHQLACAMHAGRHAAERARLSGTQLFIGAGVGAAGTPGAAALAWALLARSRERLPALDGGPTAPGLEAAYRALALHRRNLDQPLEALRRLGGYELAALTGSFLACAHMGIPVLVDGFVTSVAALAAMRLCPGARHWLLGARRAPGSGHRAAPDAMGMRSVWDLATRPEGGCRAAAAVPLLRLACARRGAAVL